MSPFFFVGFIADELASYRFAFYTAGSMFLLSGAVQMILICFKSPVNETNTELNTAVTVTVVTDSEETGVENQYEESDHKEYLARLYVKSMLKKNCNISASVESIQFL